MPTTRTVLDDLTEAVGGHASEAGDTTVGGVPARWVASPGSTDEASALLKAAARHDLHVVIRGRGTAVHWGNPPRELDLVVGTERLDGVVEHEAGDLICVVQAGTTLDTVNAQVAESGQQLALDQPVPGASVGGTMATTRSGPRRMLYGTPRDLVLGVTMVRADGVVAKAGGKVVKNVAGYDLAKLLGGAYGTLGLVTRMVVRLHPLPKDSRWLTRTLPAAEAAATALELAGSQLAPSAVDVRRDAGSDDATVLVLLEGTERGVSDRSDEAARVLGLDGSDGADVDTAQIARLDTAADDTLVKVAVPLPGVAAVLAAARVAEHRHGVSCRVQGSAGTGVLHAVVSGAPDAAAATVTALRTAAADGSAVALSAPAAVREQVDCWGPVGGLHLMRRVKDEFDPDHRLAAGRFVGGI